MRPLAVSALALFALALCSFEAKATTVIAVWTPDATFIAADAKLSHSSENSPSETACKINDANNVFWAAAGLTQDTSTGYSINKVVAKAMEQPLSLEKRISSFEIGVTKALTVSTNNMYNNYRSSFDRNISHSTALEVIFSGYENGVNYLFVRSFSASFDPESKSVKVYATENMSCPCGDSYTKILGFHSAIDAELRRNPGTFDTPTENGSALKRLIERQIASSPDAVGPPISTVEMQKGAPHWIDKGACKAN